MDGYANDHSILAARARTLLAAGRPAAAAPLIATLSAPLAGSAELAELQARLNLAEGDPAGACAVLDPAIVARPQAPALLLVRAEARLRRDDTAGAVSDAAEAVLAAPDSADAKAILGIALVDLGRNEDALPCLDEAVATQPDNPWFREALAAAFERNGDPTTAARVLADGITRAPAYPGLRSAAILLALGRDDPAGALALAEAARHDGAADARVIGLLACTLALLGRNEEAAEAHAEAQKLAPERSAAARTPPADGPSPADAAVVAGHHATCLDSGMIWPHGPVPGMMRQMLGEGIEARPWLDLGCGSGIVALALGERAAGPATGVDPSAAMLHEAAATDRYAELIEAEATAFLAADHRRWHLIAARDLLGHVDELAPLFAQLRTRLAPGGRLLASMELADEPVAASPRPHGRYAHGRATLDAALGAAGLQLLEARAGVLRLEAGHPVRGLVFCATAAAADA